MHFSTFMIFNKIVNQKLQYKMPLFFIFAEYNTRFFTPKSYKTNDLSKLEQFINDLNSITAQGGGDGPEYGIGALSRALKASIQRVDGANGQYSHIILITDASAKDYDKIDDLFTALSATDIVVSAFLPQNSSSSGSTCPERSSSTYEQCIRRTMRGYTDLIKSTSGVLVKGITRPAALKEFSEYWVGTIPGHISSQISCSKRKKRALSSLYKRQTLIAISISKACTYVQNFSISELAIHFELTITTAVRDPIHVQIHNTNYRIVKSANISDSIAFFTFQLHDEGVIPGLWYVCSDEEITLDVTIENNFVYSVELLNDVGSEPVSLPPNGCRQRLPVLISSPHFSRLQLESTQYLSVVNSRGAIHQHVPLQRCGLYFNGHIDAPGEPFHLQFHGVTEGGHSFNSKFIEFTPIEFPWILHVIPIVTHPEISPDTSVAFAFRLSMNFSQWHKCSLTVEIEASTNIHGVRVTAQPSHVNLSHSIVSLFFVHVSATSDISHGPGKLELIFKDISNKELLRYSDTTFSACPCRHGGTCSTIKRGSRVFNRCICPSGYWGLVCEHACELYLHVYEAGLPA